MNIAHFGTFDVENYGDLVFPLVLKKRLSDISDNIIHVSPIGGPPVWDDCVGTINFKSILRIAQEVDGVVIGGGHLIHSLHTSLEFYQSSGLTSFTAYPSLWLGAAYLAADRNIPLCWNAPGVPLTFKPIAARNIQWTNSVTDYLSLRDRASEQFFREAGVTGPIHVVPDTALEVSSLWKKEEISREFSKAFANRDGKIPERTIVFHVKARYLNLPISEVATCLDRICNNHDVTAILIAMGPCHGDDTLQRQVARNMTTNPLVIDRPQSMCEIAACIAHADAYVGSSLHGLITACSFGRRGLLVGSKQVPKFRGFLEQFHLSSWHVESWLEAEQMIEDLLRSPINQWERVMEIADPILDQHWKQLKEALQNGISVKGESKKPPDKKKALKQFSTMVSEYVGDYAIFQPMLIESLGDQVSRMLKIEAYASELRVRLTEVEERLKNREEELSNIRKDLNRTKSESAEYQSRISEQAKEIAAFEDELSTTRTNFLDRETKLRNQEHELSRLDKDLELSKKELSRAQSELLASKSMISEQEKIITVFEEDLSSTRDELMKIEKRSNIQDNELSVLKKDLVSKQSEISGFQSELEATQRLLSVLEIDLEERQEDIQSLVRWIEDLEGGIAALLSTRRWKVGNRIGDLWQRISRKPQVPIATDFFAHIFALFHTWREGWWERQRKKGSEDLPITTDEGRFDRAGIEWITTRAEFKELTADIVICIHNALTDVKRCLASILRHTDPRHRLIIVDDGSDTDTSDYLQGFAEQVMDCTLIRNDKARGYTVAANQGLKASQGDYVVLLNSDTIVTPEWLEKILECGESDSKIGVIGPLSNSASWQSVPELYDRSIGDWATNPLPKGWTSSDMADIVALVSEARFPRVPFINGFCYTIKREVIDAIGYFDEVSFPQGFAEENDYSIRVANAGFDLAIADHAFVFHAKSRSYSDERRRALSKQNMVVLRQKHGGEKIDEGVAFMRREPTLEDIRQRVRLHIENLLLSPEGKKIRVLFVLPVPGGAGGAHSVVTEAIAMRKMGVDAQVATELRYLPKYRANYPNVEKIHELFYFYQMMDELVDYASGFDVVVGTIYHSMNEVKAIVDANSHVRSAYYVQDYEPNFFKKGSKEYKMASASYTLVPSTTLFAKTNWVCEMVQSEHDVKVHKVSPSIDHEIFFPPLWEHKDGFPVRIIAMIRPKSVHRGGTRTMKILRKISQDYGEKVDIHIFGCSEEEVEAYGLVHDFGYSNHGVLVREEVGDLLRQIDVFVDFSDWQAFGRTGLEAMACGCATILPEEGGANEFAIDRHNALLVDTSLEETCYQAVRELIDDEEIRYKLQANGPPKAAEYSTYRAAMSELLVLFEEEQLGIKE